MIDAGAPSSFGLGLGDGHVLTFWHFLYRYPELGYNPRLHGAYNHASDCPSTSRYAILQGPPGKSPHLLSMGPCFGPCFLCRIQWSETRVFA